MDFKEVQLPQALENRLQDQLGPSFKDFSDALMVEAPVSIRLNPGKPNDNFENTQPVSWSNQGRYLASRPRFTDDPLFHAGTYYVQDASSMFLEYVMNQVIDLDQRLRILDLSAAPGGKSTLLQSIMSQDSLLVANEIIGNRNKILKQNLTRWGGDNHIVTQSDPKYFKSIQQFFDVIVVDAPCSGEGLIRKDHAAIQEWSEHNVQLCASRQKRILADVLPALSKHGILIYSTCTFSKSENEENMEWLEQEAGLEAIPLDVPTSFGIVKSGPKDAGHRFYPHKLKGEGFFIAAFRKISTELPERSVHRPPAKVSRSGLPTDEDQRWLVEADDYVYIEREQHRTALRKSMYQDYLTLSRSLRITHAGLYLGKVYHGELKPSPELALSRFISSSIPKLELTKEESLDYLAHIQLSSYRGLDAGYYLVTHSGYGLGWLHILKTGQVRNKYPSAWRILKR